VVLVRRDLTRSPSRSSGGQVLARAGESGDPEAQRSARPSDADGDSLSYSVLHGVSRLGATIGVDGAFASYTPPAGVSSGTDDFVYVVDDGKGGVGATVVSVTIGN
jgi:hypothetical protein